MSVAAQRIQVEIGLSNVQIGSILSAFILGYAVLQFPAGLIVDRVGPYRVLFFSAFGWSVFTLLTSASAWLQPEQVPAALMATRLAAGAAQAGVLTCVIKSIAQWMPPHERATGNGLSMMGLGIGGALSPPLFVWLTSVRDWPFAFIVLGCTGLAIAAMWRVFATESPKTHRSVNHAELVYIGETTAQRSPATPWRSLFTSRSVWALAISYGVGGYTSYVFFTWFFLYLVNVRGMSVAQGGIWGGLPYVAVAIGTFAGGRTCDALSRRLGRRWGRLAVVLAGEVLAAILIPIGGRVEDAHFAVILLSLATGLHLFGQSASWAAAVDLSSAHAGVLFGVMNTMAQIAGTIAPIATPWIAGRFGWVVALDFAAVMVTLAAALWLAVDTSKPVTPDPAL